MAGRSKGPQMFFKRVRRAATKAQPYLIPGARLGRRVMVAALRRGIATLQNATKRAVNEVVERAARAGAFAALQAAQRKAPVDKGRLRASLNARRRSPTLWTVGTNVRYARWVEKGTRGGRIIRPKNKRALAFNWKNAPAGMRRRGRGKRR
jgi:hypothetical protein